MNTEKEIVNRINFANRQKNIKHLMQLSNEKWENGKNGPEKQ